MQQVDSSAADKSSDAQQVAVVRARWMQRNNYRGHPPTSVANWARFGRFEGVGWSSDPGESNCPTCVTNGRPIADAVSRGPNGTFRVRIW